MLMMLGSKQVNTCCFLCTRSDFHVFFAPWQPGSLASSFLAEESDYEGKKFEVQNFLKKNHGLGRFGRRFYGCFSVLIGGFKTPKSSKF